MESVVKNLHIIKRSGMEVPFDVTKIENAIKAANMEVDNTKRLEEKEIQSIAKKIENDLMELSYEASVEDIQDKVEVEIMAFGHPEVAQKYVRYRYDHEMQRNGDGLINKVLALIDQKSEAIKQENSNKNPMINSTQRDYMAGEVSKEITFNHLLPADVVEAHNAGILHFHDADYFGQLMTNCTVFNLEDMLQNGTMISETLIEKPKSFHTACNITTQIVAQVASNQYGGQTFTLAHLVPFIDVSRKKIRKEVLKEIDIIKEDLSSESIEKIVHSRLLEEIKKGVQTIQYQLLTLLTTNGQTPFVTIFMYLDEVPEEQRDDLAILIEEVIKQRMQGVKNSKGVWITPAFPKLIYVLDEDNIHEDSKYYYLTELAAKCTAKRMVPDYISAKVAKELKKGNVYPCMGCVEGTETVSIKLDSEDPVTYSFEKLWDEVSSMIAPKEQFEMAGNPNLYVDTSKANVYISDMIENDYVKVLAVIRNVSNDWVQVTFSNGTIIKCTSDHPFHTVNEGTKQAKDLVLGEDMVYVKTDGGVNTALVTKVVKLDFEAYSYDVTTASSHFDVSGVYSHNCRSFLTVEDNLRNEDGTHKFYGRSTIINALIRPSLNNLNTVEAE